MADTRDLLVRILGDDKSLQAAFTRTERRAKGFETRTKTIGVGLSRAFGAAGIALGGAAVFAATARAVKGASDLNEEVSKSRQVFGSASREIEEWSRTTADAMGIAQTDALRATGTFGNLFRTIGTGADEASAMSQRLVQLASDLASFNNADPSDVLQAIRSGLIGEAEPLRRYGVLLSEARVQQLAMAQTGKTNVKEITNQEKALARYQIILQDTAGAQGDFARTSDSLANQSRILKANMQELSTEMGTHLLPAVLKVTRGINDLFDAFERAGKGARFEIDIENTDLTRLQAVRAEIAGLTGESHLLVRALDQVIQRLRDIQPPRPDDRGGLQGIGAVDASNAAVDQRNADRQAAKTKADLERSRRRFATFVKGLGLKLDRAGLTSSLNDDLAVLREIERAIQRRINAEGKTFELISDLTDVQLQIASVLERRQGEAETRQQDAIDKKIERQRKAREQKRKRAEDAARRRQGDQFEAIGLTQSGDDRVPGVGALRRRLGNLRDLVEGTVLDTDKTENQLDRIAKVLSGKFGAVGKDVRTAILRMFNDISSALGEGDKKMGPLTKTTGLNTKRIIAGLGLSDEEARELRGRLSKFNSAGLGLAGGQTTGGARGGFTGGTGFVIENNVTVAIDGQKFSAVVTKQQQKQKRRNPRQKRGPNRNL